MLLRQDNAPLGSGKNVWAGGGGWVEMVEKRGKNVDSRSLLSTHPCHHFLCVILGPWTAESIGFFFYYYQEKYLEWSASEVPLTLNLL